VKVRKFEEKAARDGGSGFELEGRHGARLCKQMQVMEVGFSQDRSS
jgi:hypothetical protein